MSATPANKIDSRYRAREGRRTMGASRDFTSKDEGINPAPAALLERERFASPGTIPRRGTPIHRPELPKRGNKRLGSKQVVSRRGRQLHQPLPKNSQFARLSVLAILLLGAGVVVAMWLSGVSAAQTFKMQQLTVQESDLSNQLETLNRDLENVRSSADVARRAEEQNLGVPTQPGIVEVDANGEVHNKREAQPGMDSLYDVNGEAIRPGQASSDPNETSDVSDALSAVPEGQQRAADEEQDAESGSQSGAENGPGAEAGAAPEAQAPTFPATAPYANR